MRNRGPQGKETKGSVVQLMKKRRELTWTPLASLCVLNSGYGTGTLMTSMVLPLASGVLVSLL